MRAGLRATLALLWCLWLAGCVAGPDTAATGGTLAATPQAGDRIDRHLPPARPVTPVAASSISITDLVLTREMIDVVADGRPEQLQSIVIRPPGPGPFPLALISHGTTSLRRDRKAVDLDNYIAFGQDMARRGYLSVIFARRGFGGSSGDFIGSDFGCDGYSLGDYARVGMLAAEDYRAMLAALQARPGVLADGAIAAGSSGGGFAVLALDAIAPPGLAAVINVSGGNGGRDVSIVGSNCNEGELIDAFASFGRTARLPALFLYSDADSLFTPRMLGRAFAAYTAAGAPARLELFGPVPFQRNGHNLILAQGRALWRPAIDRFLTDLGLPGGGAIPAEPLPDLQPLPAGLGARQTLPWFWYLNAPDHRAVAVSPKGGIWATGNRDDVATAEAAALNACRRAGGEDCRVISSDGAPVEAGTAPESRKFLPARTVPADRRSLIWTLMGAKGCTAWPRPRVDLFTPPVHGRLEVVPATRPIREVRTTAAYAACDAPADLVELYYTPDPGFTGTDYVVFQAAWPDQPVIPMRIDLTVAANP